MKKSHRCYRNSWARFRLSAELHGKTNVTPNVPTGERYHVHNRCVCYSARVKGNDERERREEREREKIEDMR